MAVAKTTVPSTGKVLPGRGHPNVPADIDPGNQAHPGQTTHRACKFNRLRGKQTFGGGEIGRAGNPSPGWAQGHTNPTTGGQAGAAKPGPAADPPPSWGTGARAGL